MKIKKNLVAATAAVLAAGMALAGCGSSNGGSGDVQKTADGKVKITMWHGFSEADGKTLESIVDGTAVPVTVPQEDAAPAKAALERMLEACA